MTVPDAHTCLAPLWLELLVLSYAATARPSTELQTFLRNQHPALQGIIMLAYLVKTKRNLQATLEALYLSKASSPLLLSTAQCDLQLPGL